MDPPSRQAILDTLAEEGAPLSIEQLIERMRVPEGALVGMRRRVAAMQRDGQILAGRKGALMLVSRSRPHSRPRVGASRRLRFHAA